MSSIHGYCPQFNNQNEKTLIGDKRKHGKVKKSSFELTAVRAHKTSVNIKNTTTQKS